MRFPFPLSWVPLLAMPFLASCRTPPLAPQPVATPTAAQEHPRLYLTDTRLNELRQAVRGTHTHLWKDIKRWTDSHFDDPIPVQFTGDIRRTGEVIPYAAICWLITGESGYRNLAARYMEGISRQEHWADDVDIEAAHLLYALAVGYDWLYDELTPEERFRFQRKLILQASRMRPRCGRRHPPLNNHRIVNLASLGTAALALQGETADAAEWLAYVETTLRETMAHFGADGLSREGISYWSYSVEYLLKYLAAVPDHDHPLFAHPWLKAAALAPIYHALPRSAWTRDNLVLNIADSPRFCWYGPQHQLFFLASRYKQPQAQWLADQLARTHFTRWHADWLGLLWYDPSVPCEDPGNAPRSHYFRDGDLAIMHGGDTDGTVCSFICGPAGSGHSHPDANSFTVFSAGAWLAVDAGSTLIKRTAYHNTVLVNGIGQKGEGQRWLQRGARRPKEEPLIVLARKEKDGDYFVGDASRIYRKEAGLKRFYRHFLYQHPSRITIVDDLITRGRSQFDWLLHTPGTIEITGTHDVVIRNKAARLTLHIVQPEDPVIRSESIPIEAEYPDDDWTRLNRLIISPRHRTRTARFAVTLQIGTEDERRTYSALE